MLAKVIAWAPTRQAAIERLNRGLEETDVRGIVTNIPFLSALVTHPSVAANTIDTGFIERELKHLTPAAPAPHDGPPELATVAACWPAVIELVRQENQLLASVLADARPVSLAGDDVTLAFPSDRAFYKRKAEQDDNRRTTADALRSVIGATLRLRYELRDEAELPAAANGLSQEELVKRLVEEFDAQEVLDDPDQENR